MSKSYCSKFLKWLWIALLFMFIQTSTALQMKSILEDDAASATASAHELTRIAVDHDRILHVRGVEGAYDLKNDASQGALFIRPLGEYQTKPFTLFIATEKNHNYVLHLTPKEEPGDTILLKPKILPEQSVHGGDSFPSPKKLADHMTQLIHAIPPPKYAVDSLSKTTPHYADKNMTVQLTRVFYLGSSLQGVVYLVTNQSGQPLSLHEHAFYQPGDRAISLSHLTIAPKGQVLLYKVRSHG
jgi:type-F conjugative transfer system secretin TraK